MIMGAPGLCAQTPPDQPRPSTGDKLGEKLLRKVEGAKDEDIMQQILQLMQDVATELQLDFDTGAETQAMQKEIVTQLDEAIRIAAAQRRASRSSSASSSDARRMAQPKSTGREGRERGRPDESSADVKSSDTAGSPGSVTEGAAAGGELKESRRSWGHLPMRARDEIIQGVGERFLERYREWVERYYRALQESEEP